MQLYIFCDRDTKYVRYNLVYLGISNRFLLDEIEANVLSPKGVLFFSEIKPRGVFPKENIFYHVVVLSRNGAFANEMFRICFCCLLVNRQHFNSIFVKWNNRHPLTSTKNKINSNPFPRRTRDEKFELPRTHTTILRMGTVSIRHFFLKTEKEKGEPFFPFTPAFLCGGFIDGRATPLLKSVEYSTTLRTTTTDESLL